MKDKYYIHKVKILTTTFFPLLKEKIIKYNLNQYCSKFSIYPYKPKHDLDPYNAYILIVLPEKLLWSLLATSSREILQFYSLSEIELVRDSIGTLEDTIKEQSTINKKWGKEAYLQKPFIDDNEVEGHLINESPTLYLGRREKFKFVIYHCKNVHNPTDNTKWIHREFRLENRKTIRDKLKIKSIDELLHLDVEKEYKKLENKYIEKVSINELKLSNYLLKKKIKKHNIKSRFTVKLFKRRYDIRSYMDLKRYIQKNRLNWNIYTLKS